MAAGTPEFMAPELYEEKYNEKVGERRTQQQAWRALSAAWLAAGVVAAHM